MFKVLGTKMMQAGVGMSGLGPQQPCPTGQSPAGQPIPGQIPQQIPQQQQQQQLQEQQKLDNVAKVKGLQWPLKEALANVMKVAAQNVYHNAAVDLGLKSSDQPQSARFDKNLEEFYSICDQIELNLKVALECTNLSLHSQRYTPFPVAALKPDLPSSPDAHSYGQYIGTVKVQVGHAKEIHDLLSNVARTDANLM